MRGAPNDGDANARPRQPADVLDEWIRALLGEVQGTYVQRLAQLCSQLHAQVVEQDHTPLAQALADMNFAGRGLAFGPLQRGWLARLLGRHRAAYARFIASHSRVVHRASEVRREMIVLGDGEPGALAARQALEDLEAQRQSIMAAIDEAVAWLQDMCTQLAEARAEGSDDARIASLAEGAQLHTRVLKRLQAAGTIAHDITVRGRSVLDRRAALLGQVRAALQEFDGNWTPRLDRLLHDLQANRNAAPAAPKAIEAHNDLMKRLAASVDACGALRHEERLLAEHVGMLREHLEGSSE